MGAYALINTLAPGPVIRRSEFPALPVLAPEKGLKWIADNPPSYAPAKQTCTASASIPVTATEVPYTVADIDLSVLRGRVKDDLAAERYGAEISGVTVSGILIATDRESQMLIDAAQRSFADGVISSVKFKTSSGTIVDCDATMASALRAAVVDHVQSCRNNEAALCAAIDSASTADEILAVDIQKGWPA
jgi:hypothetical protein